MSYYMTTGHENLEGLQWEAITQKILQKEKQDVQKTTSTIIRNTVPIHGNAQKLTKTSNVSSLSKSGRNRKFCITRKVLTLFARKEVSQQDCI